MPYILYTHEFKPSKLVAVLSGYLHYVFGNYLKMMATFEKNLDPQKSVTDD